MWFIISIIYMNYGDVAPEILVYKSIFKSKSLQFKFDNGSHKIVY